MKRDLYLTGLVSVYKITRGSATEIEGIAITRLLSRIFR